MGQTEAGLASYGCHAGRVFSPFPCQFLRLGCEDGAGMSEVPQMMGEQQVAVGRERTGRDVTGTRPSVLRLLSLCPLRPHPRAGDFRMLGPHHHREDTAGQGSHLQQSFSCSRRPSCRCCGGFPACNLVVLHSFIQKILIG